MNHNNPQKTTFRRVLRAGPIALMALMMVSTASALPLGASIGLDTPAGPVSADAHGTSISAHTPAGSADIDGTSVSARTPVASADASADGTHVSACADASTPELGLGVGAQAGTCVDEDAGQIAEDAAPNGLKGLVRQVRNFLGSLF